MKIIKNDAGYMLDEYYLAKQNIMLLDHVAQVYAQIVDLKPESNVDYKRDDIGWGDLFAEVFGFKHVYVKEAKCWYCYNGKVWYPDNKDAVETSEALKEFIRILQYYSNELPDNEDNQAFAKKIWKLTDRRERDRILKDAKSYSPISITRFDNNPFYLNCQNGTLDLEHNSFHTHTPEDYLTMITDCLAPTPSERYHCDRWTNFIKEITEGDEEIGKYLQRALGYSLVGKANEECMFIAFGKTTRNGKGTLLNTIYSILGDYAKTIDVRFICQTKFGSAYSMANPMLCSLKGARLVVMSESDDSAKLADNTIKNYTGGDPISTRQLYGEAFSFTPQFKMWLQCNTLPIIQDRSLFSSDRIRVIEFNHHFGPGERDKTLKDKFKDPNVKRAILQWLLDGWYEYQKTGLNEPKKILDTVDNYENKNDRVGLFIDESISLTNDDSDRLGRTVIYKEYKNWCLEQGYKPKSAQKFYEDMDRYAKQRVYGGNRVYVGVEFK